MLVAIYFFKANIPLQDDLCVVEQNYDNEVEILKLIAVYNFLQMLGSDLLQ